MKATKERDQYMRLKAKYDQISFQVINIINIRKMILLTNLKQLAFISLILRDT